MTGRILRNAIIYDGTGKEPFCADISINGDRISSVGAVEAQPGIPEEDLDGLAVAPGFIDAHTHDDRLLLSDSAMTPKVSQGVTTVVGGNCGISLAPLSGIEPPAPLNLLGDKSWFQYERMSDYRDSIEQAGMATNCAMLVGHSTLRVGSMGRLDRNADTAELKAMSARIEEAMTSGCIGMSTGLAYPTAQAASTAEIIALNHEVARMGGLHATHIRDEGDFLVESVDEAIEISTSCGIDTVISHHKSTNQRNWGKTAITLQHIREAKKSCNIHFDVYPYVASSTVLLADFVEQAQTTRITWSEPHPEMAGKYLDVICDSWHCDLDSAIDRLSPAGAVYFEIDEDELQSLLCLPDTMVGSDGLPHDVLPHPRLWGTFPRVLGHYARDLGLMPLEQGIHQMTGLTAAVFGLSGRGEICPGSFADLVVFDPVGIADTANFDDPVQPSSGIRQVLVNGDIVWKNGEPGGSLPGKWLSREA